jgi:hypothetical protein
MSHTLWAPRACSRDNFTVFSTKLRLSFDQGFQDVKPGKSRSLLKRLQFISEEQRLIRISIRWRDKGKFHGFRNLQA